MRVVDFSERTVPGGMWYEVMCTSCLFREDAFKPRRKPPKRQ